ncbi:LysM peptidoglycan-binding domain-containing protein [Bacillus sp. B190/17]|uniref:LysM peptidoglycan-binding domain-containing protein n=1 Tax=Bacillus lumedeiriae TaxID=3058829 RepID=A0ABW8IBJ1_9BACI
MKKTLFTLSTAAVFSAGTAVVVEASEQHTVKHGETLYSIAQQYHTDVTTLKSLNDLGSDELKVNQVLTVTQSVVKTSAPASPSSETHIVQTGETLYSIAKHYQIGEEELNQLNGLKDSSIYAGQKLKVSGQPPAAAEKQPAVQHPLPAAESHTKAAKPALPAPVKQMSVTGTYIVQSGDTLGAIAKAYGMDVAELQQLNALKNYTVYAGQKLKVSGKPSSANQQPTTNTRAVASGTYTVKSGDSLGAIAKAYNISVSQLQQLNGLNSYLIYAGQTLKVSGKPSTASPAPVQAKPSAPAETPSSSGIYIVKSGDSLSLIAKNHKMSVADLKRLNQLTSDAIYVGQKLKVSGQSSPTAPSAPPKPSAPTDTSSSSGVYIVKSGDSLSLIAKKHKMSVAELKQLNKLTSDAIYVGQKLKVSGQPSSAAPSTPPKPSTPSEPPSSSGIYIVKSGDSLSAIAKKHKMSVAELKQLNKLASDAIFVGQKLKVTNEGTGNSGAPSNKPVVSNPSFSVSGLIGEAKKHLNTPYVWGGVEPSGFDCSGFIYYVFNKAGKNIPRVSTEGYYSRSYYVDKPQAGDLVFFANTYKKGISHMGIYIGGNQFIQASSSQGITITSLDNSYFKQRFDSFKRFY